MNINRLAAIILTTWTDYFPKHPFPMKATFQECFLVNFAIEPSFVERLLPKSIKPSLFCGKAYLSVVIARLYRMRPSFVPAALGVTFHQVVYRIVVECGNERGVYFLRSDADSPFMALGGKLLTNFHFHKSQVSFKSNNDLIVFSVTTSSETDASISSCFDIKNANYLLPDYSHFDNLDEAKIFLVELYQAFSINKYTGLPMTVKIQRSDWDIKVVKDLTGSYKLMQNSSFFNKKNTELDSIFYIKNVDYYWSTRKRFK